MAESEVEVKLKATGADETAAGIQKVEKSTEDLTDGVEDLKKELGPVTTAAKAASDALEDVAEKADDSADKLGKLVNIQRAAVANEIAKGLGMIGDHVKKAAKDFEESDPEFSKTLEGMSSGLDAATGAMAGAAQGFAVGGPFGAAIGALVGGLMPKVKEAFDDMTKSIQGASSAEALAVEMKEKLLEAQENFTAAVLSDEITDQYTRQSDALKGLIDQLNDARQVTAAEDKVSAAQRDNSDAAAIRGGAAPEDVKAKRAADDAARAKARIDYELETEATILRQKQKLADEAEAGSAKQKADKGSTPEQIAAAEKMAKEAREAADEAERKYDQNSTVKGLDKVAIDERASGKISALQATKSTREEAEKEKADQAKAKADAAAAKQAADALRESQRAEMEAKRTKLAGTAAGNQAQLQGKGKKAGLGDIGKDIGNADTEAEIAAVGEQIKAKQGELGAVTVAALKQMLAGQASLVKEIEILKQKIRNN